MAGEMEVETHINRQMLASSQFHHRPFTPLDLNTCLQPTFFINFFDPSPVTHAKRMDVVWGETAGVDGQLWLLCPMLFVLQGIETYIGFLLLKTAYLGIASDWQVLFFGFLLVVTAIGNFVNTLQMLMIKSKFKAKMKKSKSKALLANTISKS